MSRRLSLREETAAKKALAQPAQVAHGRKMKPCVAALQAAGSSSTCLANPWGTNLKHMRSSQALLTATSMKRCGSQPQTLSSHAQRVEAGRLSRHSVARRTHLCGAQDSSSVHAEGIKPNQRAAPPSAVSVLELQMHDTDDSEAVSRPSKNMPTGAVTVMAAAANPNETAISQACRQHHEVDGGGSEVKLGSIPAFEPASSNEVANVDASTINRCTSSIYSMRAVVLASTPVSSWAQVETPAWDAPFEWPPPDIKCLAPPWWSIPTEMDCAIETFEREHRARSARAARAYNRIERELSSHRMCALAASAFAGAVVHLRSNRFVAPEVAREEDHTRGTEQSGRRIYRTSRSAQGDTGSNESDSDGSASDSSSYDMASSDGSSRERDAMHNNDGQLWGSQDGERSQSARRTANGLDSRRTTDGDDGWTADAASLKGAGVDSRVGSAGHHGAGYGNSRSQRTSGDSNHGARSHSRRRGDGSDSGAREAHHSDASRNRNRVDEFEEAHCDRASGGAGTTQAAKNGRRRSRSALEVSHGPMNQTDGHYHYRARTGNVGSVWGGGDTRSGGRGSCNGTQANPGRSGARGEIQDGPTGQACVGITHDAKEAPNHCSNALTRSGNAIGARERTKWRIDDSIWAPRVAWCDSKAFVDSEEVERRRISNDWWRACAMGVDVLVAKRDDDGSVDADNNGIADELEEIIEVLCKLRQLIFVIFMYYTCIGNDICFMYLNQWSQFVDDFKLASNKSKFLKKSDLDRLFIAVDTKAALVQQARQGKAGHGASQGCQDDLRKKVLSRVEFMVALVNIAIMRYVLTKEMGDVSEALHKLLAEDIGPRLSPAILPDPNVFRTEVCYQPDVDAVLKQQETSLRSIFTAVCVIGGRGEKERHMHTDEWKLMLRWSEMLSADCSERDATMCFAWSRMCVVDETTERGRFRESHLPFEGFCEAMVRLSTLKALPTDQEIEELECDDAGEFFAKLQAEDEERYDDMLSQRGREWGSTPIQPVARCVDHLCCMLIRRVEGDSGAASRNAQVTLQEAKSWVSLRQSRGMKDVSKN